MCCDLGPPDINLLGEPPKPPGLDYNLECVGSSVLQHYDTTPFSTTSRGLSSSSTVNIVLIVVLSLVAVLLLVCSAVLWYKRKVLLKENQVKNEIFSEDSQYLYNFRQVGKIWKLPRAALLINRAGKAKHGEAGQKPRASPTENTPIYEDASQLTSDASLPSQCNSPAFQGYGGKNTLTSLGPVSPINPVKFQSGMDRASSTTSGISSDGDFMNHHKPGSRIIPNGDVAYIGSPRPLPSVNMRRSRDSSSHSRSKRQRRRHSEHRGQESPGDHLSDHDTREVRSHRRCAKHAQSLPRRSANPPPPNVSPHTLARFRAELCRDHTDQSHSARDVPPQALHENYFGSQGRHDFITPRMLQVIPQNDHVSMRSAQISMPFNDAPQYSAEMVYASQYPQYGTGYTGYGHPQEEGVYEEIPYQHHHNRGIIEPLPSEPAIGEMENSGKRKKKKRSRRQGGSRERRHESEERRHNAENELRESYA